jgi:RNA polymerase sigma factor (sigma-70 family)
VTQFQDLVGHILKKFIKPGIDQDDLLQEGYCGLLKAYDRYDPNRGITFMTYAYPWVYSAMQTHVESFSSGVRISHGGATRLRREAKHRQREGIDFQFFAEAIPKYDYLEYFEKRRTAADDLNRQIDGKIVYEAIMFLPLTHQRILLSHFFEEKHFSELPEEMGVSKQRCFQIYQEAIALLRKRLRIKVTAL